MKSCVLIKVGPEWPISGVPRVKKRDSSINLLAPLIDSSFQSVLVDEKIELFET